MVVSRVDIDRIQMQVEYQLDPVYLVMVPSGGEDLPVQLSVPDFSDEGPHLGYAFQWFGFAVILLAGYYFFARKQLMSSD